MAGQAKDISSSPNPLVKVLRSSLDNIKATSEDPRKRHNHKAPRHQKKERWWTNSDTTNVTYETTDTQNKEELQQRNRLEMVSRKQVLFVRTSPLILMQLQITNICSVPVPVLYLISKHHIETYQITNTVMKQSKELNGDLIWSQNTRKPPTGPHWAWSKTLKFRLKPSTDW